jgi:hypothetical protein
MLSFSSAEFDTIDRIEGLSECRPIDCRRLVDSRTRMCTYCIKTLGKNDRQPQMDHVPQRLRVLLNVTRGQALKGKHKERHQLAFLRNISSLLISLTSTHLDDLRQQAPLSIRGLGTGRLAAPQLQ